MGTPVLDQVGFEMIVYVAEISGRGIAAFDAANDIEAQAQLANRGLLRDLIVLQNEGRALWDGVADIHLRTATLRRPRSGKQAGRRLFSQVRIPMTRVDMSS